MFSKYYRTPLKISLAHNTPWSVFKALGKGLEGFTDEFKAQKSAFGERYIRVLKNFLPIPITNHDECKCDAWSIYFCDDKVETSLITKPTIHYFRKLMPINLNKTLQQLLTVYIRVYT